MKKILIAYKKINGKCSFIGICKNVDENELNKLTNEMEETIQKELLEKETMQKKINDLELLIEKLQHEIKVIKGEE